MVFLQNLVRALVLITALCVGMTSALAYEILSTADAEPVDLTGMQRISQELVAPPLCTHTRSLSRVPRRSLSLS